MDDAELARHLEALERRLLDVSARGSVQVLDALLAEDFYEVGASGTAYDKGKVVRLLSVEVPARHSLSDFALVCRDLATAVVTYRLTSRADDVPEVESARCSVWVFRDRSWQMRYHQGTHWMPFRAAP